jgi:hypothetical protein
MTDTSSASKPASSSSLPLTPPSSLTVIKDPRYQRGKIYQIIVLHEDYKDDLYVGSTICPKLSTRFGQHKIEAEKDEPTKKLHVLMKTIGMRFFKIVLIEDWPCDNKQELLKREQYHMNLWKPTLNMIRSYSTEDERTEYLKDYREENKVSISARMKDWYEKNTVAIKAQKKAYREENKIAISAHQKHYARENKDAVIASQKAYRQKNRLVINARKRDRRAKAKAKLSYKDLVFLAVKEALALRAERQRNRVVIQEKQAGADQP